MLRIVLSIVGGLVLLGLGYALLEVFNGDLGAIFEWAINFFTEAVKSIGAWFQDNPMFQRAVTS